jgi:hypothetical protein
MRFWALGQNSRTLLANNPELLPEVLALNLSDTGDRSEPHSTLEALCPELEEEPDPRSKLLEQARKVRDAYHGSRALLRLAPHLPDQAADLVREALRRAEKIDDPHHKAQVLEQALLVTSPGSRAELLAIALRTARAIPDPDDRARALARLAFHQPPAQQPATLKQALAAADSVANPSQRAELLHLLLPMVLPFPLLLRSFRRAVERSGGAWEHTRAVDFHGPPLLAASATPLLNRVSEDVQVWAPMVLSALVADILRPETDRSSIDGLWADLARAPHEVAVAALVGHGQNDGLAFSRTAALVLDALVGQGQTALMRPLLSLLARPEPETLPVLQRWLESADEAIRDHAALLLAEINRLDSRTVAAIVRLLPSTEDRTRHRAVRTLTHPAGVPVWPTFCVSLLGSSALELLIGESLRVRESRPAVALVLSWLHTNLVYDQPGLIAEWARRGVEGGPTAAVALAGLASIEAVTAPVWQALLDALQLPSPVVRTAVLRSICQILHREPLKDPRRPLSKEQWEAFLAVVSGIDRQMLRDEPVLQGGAREVVRAAQAALGQKADERDAIDVAEAALLRDHATTLAALLELPPEQLRKQLAEAAANNLFITVEARKYLAEARQAAAPVKNNKALFQLLLRWLRRSLHGATSEPPLYRKGPSLLLAVAGAAAAEPVTLLNLVTEDPQLAGLETLLVDAATRFRSRAGRCAALTLLGYLRRATRDVLSAMQSAMTDSQDVRDGALLAITHFRQFDGADLDALTGRSETTTGLYHDSAMAAFATAQLLVALARGERTTAAQRAQILAALADAIRHPRSRRVVHFGYTDAQVPDMPRLDQAFYRALVSVAGLD